ncbi:hypothetical protein V1514DRAFT_164620 [Lipomyces japonicus]|uniref:uncharacterized protein n=1 Tax=Lipomyces japonicus TaxID=56871 RepID=UPI0034CF8E36
MTDISVQNNKTKKRKRHSDAVKDGIIINPSANPEHRSPAHKRKHSVSATVLANLPKRTLDPAEPLGNPTVTECFFFTEASLYLSLAPMYALTPLQGLRTQHLDPLTMTYYPPVGGVVLACLDVEIDKRDGAKIAGDSPFAFTWVTAKFLVWRPKRGDILQGRINLQARSHIGLLVNDVFNASITRDKIPATWKFIENKSDEDSELGTPAPDAQEDEELAAEDEDQENEQQEELQDLEHKSLGYWVDEYGEKIEGKLTFVIESLQTSSKVVSVAGSLIKLGHVKEDLTAPGN